MCDRNSSHSPFVSVIIPTYNRADFLRSAIDSVLSQTYSRFEIIVVDDGSTDDTAQLLSSYGRSIRCIKQENKGVSAARNAGIKASSHDLLAFLDSDDCFVLDKLEQQVAAMQKSDCLASHTQEIWYRRGKLLNQKKRHRKDDGMIFSRCLELCAVGMSTVMARRALFDEVGMFNESLPCCEDYDLWLRVSVRLPFLLVDEPLTIKHGGREDQLSVRYRVGIDKYRIQAILDLLDAEKGLNAQQRTLAEHELAAKSRIYGNGCRKHGHGELADYYLGLAEKYSSQSAVL